MNFTDVNESAYYAEAVRWAVSENITAGTGANAFSPRRPLHPRPDRDLPVEGPRLSGIKAEPN